MSHTFLLNHLDNCNYMYTHIHNIHIHYHSSNQFLQILRIKFFKLLLYCFYKCIPVLQSSINKTVCFTSKYARFNIHVIIVSPKFPVHLMIYSSFFSLNLTTTRNAVTTCTPRTTRNAVTTWTPRTTIIAVIACASIATNMVTAALIGFN